MANDARAAFRELHRTGTFIMPNPWDIGSARMLASLGFPALATTSSGHAATLGLRDQQVSRDELLVHAAGLAAAVEVPLSVDSERCFADDPAGVAETVRLIGQTGASGCSIEDYDPAAKTIDDIGVATERVAAAAEAAHEQGMLLTARAEAYFYGSRDLDGIIRRLIAYRGAGADVVYAPGLASLQDIARIVTEVGGPVNVLALPHGPSVPELASVGVRRVSTGGILSRAVHGTLVSAARELLDVGTSTYATGTIAKADIETAFVDRSRG
ncbi:MAG TPA: isocitrate lyase/phosphoenolpyruvate mutase family protein [Egibacteraceae bacterium]|nr:isocitrate lyase/phosphoenolpyruvate mutase family protein [Egibacteraceae bacterium]